MVRYFDLINELIMIIKESEREITKVLDFNPACEEVVEIEKYVVEMIKCFVDGDIERYIDDEDFSEKHYNQLLFEVSSKEKDLRLTHWMTNTPTIESSLLNYRYIDNICNQVTSLVEMYIRTEIKKNHGGRLGNLV